MENGIQQWYQYIFRLYDPCSLFSRGKHWCLSVSRFHRMDTFLIGRSERSQLSQQSIALISLTERDASCLWAFKSYAHEPLDPSAFCEHPQTNHTNTATACKNYIVQKFLNANFAPVNNHHNYNVSKQELKLKDTRGTARCCFLQVIVYSKQIKMFATWVDICIVIHEVALLKNNIAHWKCFLSNYYANMYKQHPQKHMVLKSLWITSPDFKLKSESPNYTLP